MHLELTKKQFRELVKAVVIGVRIREAAGEGRNTRGWQKIDEIEGHLLSVAKDFGCEDMAEHFLNSWIPSDALSEETDEELEEYDDQEFWHRLEVGLGQRDFYRTVTKEEQESISDNKGLFPERVHKLYHLYETEFEVHGLERLEVVSDVKPSRQAPVVQRSQEDSLQLRLSRLEYEALEGVLVLSGQTEALIARAEPSGKGRVLTGSYAEFDELADSVAAEANHCSSHKKQKLFDRICDKINDLLG